ncbi:WD40 repeat-like protein [Daedaleopsis nitida]|nr:WD40 repeat-like protein [Daedaleopsis nitida]
MTTPSPVPSSLLALRATASNSKGAPAATRRYTVDNLLRDGLPYSRKLVAHTSCVNALAFSRDGRWFASAGDDPYVQIWDFDQDEVSIPSVTFSGPRSNVFTVAFSASGQYVYSGDTSDVIHQYDLSQGLSVTGHAPNGSLRPSWSNTQHDDSIRAISCHPENDQLLLSAAEDGRIILHDMRAGSLFTRAQGTLFGSAEFTDVQYHPTMTNLFATSDHRGHVRLRDLRMAFGPLSQRSNRGVVQKYVTTVSRQGKGRMARPEASSLTFDRDGRRLGVTMLHFLPTLYAVNDPYPIACLSGRHFPDGSLVSQAGQDQTYSNSCTMKHGSFGGLGSDRDMYYAEGSDDFRTYIWKIPDESTLLERRESIAFDDWNCNPQYGDVAYATSPRGPRVVPVELSVPHTRLTGHNSIVNTALIHPHRPWVLTAGIERYIRLHSPTAASPSTEPLEPTPTEVRSVSTASPSSREGFLRAMGIIGGPPPEEEEEEDRQAIALFDRILRQEGQGDVFAICPWEGGSDESSEGERDESGEDDDSEDDMEVDSDSDSSGDDI